MTRPFLLLAFLAISTSIFAQDLPVKTISLFKNDRAIIEQGGTVNVKNKTYETTAMPNALFGTYWVEGPGLASISTRVDTIEKAREGKAALSLSMFDFYTANLGKSVKVELPQADGSIKTIKGTIAKILTSNALNESSKLMLKGENGVFSIVNIGEVLHVDFLEIPNMESTHTHHQRTLVMNFESNRSSKIKQQYLAPKLGWTPVYQLILDGDKKATLSLQAQLHNDQISAKDVDIKLMVGIPNFVYATRASELFSFGEIGRQSLSSGRGIPGGAANVMSQTVSFDAGTYEAVPVRNTSKKDASSKAEDYFFYKTKLKVFPKNSRHQLSIFTEKLATEHYYESNLEAVVASRYSFRNNNKKGNKYFPVNHMVAFQNKSKLPFTTGIVNISTLKNGDAHYISQDNIPYAAPNAPCKVKVAESSEVQVSHKEGTTDVKMDVIKTWGTNYDQVSIEGEICIVNYKTEAVKVKINRNVEGKMLDSDIDWKVNQNDASLGLNKKNAVTWEFELKPGEEKKWKYSYEVIGNW